MGFKKFTTADKQKVDLPPPAVTINTVGKIIFNKSAEFAYDFSKLKFAILWFDDKRNMVSISFANDEKEDGALKLSYTDNIGYYVNAKSFLAWAKIPHEKSGTFQITEKSNNFIFTVKKNQMKSRAK